jgi:hypothetical protein
MHMFGTTWVSIGPDWVTWKIASQHRPVEDFGGGRVPPISEQRNQEA